MADEKIRLVLSTSGGQDIKELEQHFTELAEALGITDFEFEKVTDVAENAKNKVKELKEELTRVDDAFSDVSQQAGQAAVAVDQVSQSANQATQPVTLVGEAAADTATAIIDVGQASNQAAIAVDQISQSTKQANQPIALAGQAATATATAVTMVGQAANQATTSVINVGQATRQATQPVAQVGQAATATAAAVNQVGQAANQATAAVVNVGQAARQTVTPIAQAGQAAAATANAMNQLGQATNAATGGGGSGSGGRGISGLAYALQDFQAAGFMAVLNNVQQLAAGIGLGAGAAGMAQIATLAMVQFGDKIKETIEEATGLKEIKGTLADVSTAIGKQTAEVENLRKEYERLSKLEDKTLANRAKLRGITEDLTESEKKLAEQKAAQAAVDKADTQQGEELNQKMEGQKQSFKEKFVDTGQMPKLKQELMRSELEKNPDLTDEEIRNRMFEVMAQEQGTSVKEARSNYYGSGMNLSPEALAASQKNTDQKYKEAARQQLQGERGEDAKTRVGRILDAFQNAKTQDELDKAFQELAQISPQRANELREYHMQRLESESLDKEVEESSGKMREQRQVREKKEATQQKSFANMGRMLNQGAKVEEKAKETGDKKEKTQEKEEKRRVEIRDKAMERMGVTPEGLAVQRQNAAVGNSKSAQVARQNTAQQQEQALLQRFQNDGMTAEQAKKTTDEIGKIGKDIVQTMLRTGAMDLTMFKQLQMTAKGQELQRMKAMQEMRAGNRQPGFQGGNQAR